MTIENIAFSHIAYAMKHYLFHRVGYLETGNFIFHTKEIPLIGTTFAVEIYGIW